MLGISSHHTSITHMTQTLSAIVLAWLLSGCSLIMSGKDVDEHIKLTQERNPIGCSYLKGSGTPPASRLDGGVIAAWGKEMTVEQMKVCIQALMEAK